MSKVQKIYLKCMQNWNHTREESFGNCKVNQCFHFMLFNDYISSFLGCSQAKSSPGLKCP